MTDLVNYSLDGDVATLTMDDGKANALGHAMVESLNAALDRAEKEAKVVVLTGRPGKFCAGFDLKVMQSGVKDMAALVTKGSDLLERLYMFPRPLIVVGSGHALAAGALTLLTGDYRIAADGDFKIGLNETAIGMALPTFGIELARETLPSTELTKATACAVLYSPQQAVKAGYVHEAASEENLKATLERITAHMLSLNTNAFAVTKDRLRKNAVERMKSATEDELATLFR